MILWKNRFQNPKKNPSLITHCREPNNFNFTIFTPILTTFDTLYVLVMSELTTRITDRNQINFPVIPKFLCFEEKIFFIRTLRSLAHLVIKGIRPFKLQNHNPLKKQTLGKMVAGEIICPIY